MQTMSPEQLDPTEHSVSSPCLQNGQGGTRTQQHGASRPAHSSPWSGAAHLSMPGALPAPGSEALQTSPLQARAVDRASVQGTSPPAIDRPRQQQQVCAADLVCDDAGLSRASSRSGQRADVRRVLRIAPDVASLGRSKLACVTSSAQRHEGTSLGGSRHPCTTRIAATRIDSAATHQQDATSAAGTSLFSPDMQTGPPLCYARAPPAGQSVKRRRITPTLVIDRTYRAATQQQDSLPVSARGKRSPWEVALQSRKAARIV